MTLILAIPAEGGIVIASDSQVTSGMVRWKEEKLKQLNSHCVWGAAGELALIQRVEEALESDPKDQPLRSIRDHLANIVRQAVSELLQLDFRTQFVQTNPDELLNLHPGDFIFAECRGEPKILHVMANGTPEWINKPFATGSGGAVCVCSLTKISGNRSKYTEGKPSGFQGNGTSNSSGRLWIRSTY